jgi:hypothetical protein
MMDLRVPQRIPFEGVTATRGHYGGRGQGYKGQGYKSQGEDYKTQCQLQRLRVTRTPSPLRRGVTYIRRGDVMCRRKDSSNGRGRNQVPI